MKYRHRSSPSMVRTGSSAVHHHHYHHHAVLSFPLRAPCSISLVCILFVSSQNRRLSRAFSSFHFVFFFWFSSNCTWAVHCSGSRALRLSVRVQFSRDRTTGAKFVPSNISIVKFRTCSCSTMHDRKACPVRRHFFTATPSTPL